VNLDPGLFYGLAIFAALVASALAFAYIRGGAARRRWEQEHPIVPGSGDALLARVAELTRPTLLLAPAQDPSFCKLGGAPELPSEAVWPTADGGEPKSFLAQLDLAALPPGTVGDWLPKDGRVSAAIPTRSRVAASAWNAST
jgi:hypothetical protein